MRVFEIRMLSWGPSQIMKTVLFSQYSSVPTNAKVGVVKGATTQSGAILLSRAFRSGIRFDGE
jgi:hypothetical protein